MERFSEELLEVINRLKQHQTKKQELLKQKDLQPSAYWDAQGRITALQHAIIELEHLYRTGEVKRDLFNEF